MQFPKPARRQPKPKRPIQRTARPKAMSDRMRTRVRERATVTRPGVLRRDGYRCRSCGFRAGPGIVLTLDRWLEVHEEPPRSLGGDMTNPADCITLCQTVNGDGCHGRAQRHDLTITKGDEGCNGPVEFSEGARTWKG